MVQKESRDRRGKKRGDVEMQEKFHAAADEQIVLMKGDTSTLCFGVIFSSPGLIRFSMQERGVFLHLLVQLRLQTSAGKEKEHLSSKAT